MRNFVDDSDSAVGETTFGPSQDFARPEFNRRTTPDPAGAWRALSMIESPTGFLRQAAEVDDWHRPMEAAVATHPETICLAVHGHLRSFPALGQPSKARVARPWPLLLC